MIKNYLLFYAVIIVFITGGIKLTSYVLEKKKKDKFENTNHHDKVSALLITSGQVKSADIKDKTILLYSWNEHQAPSEDFAKLNTLNTKSSGKLAIYATSTLNKEHVEIFFLRKKVIPQFKSLYGQRALSKYYEYLGSNFYDSDSLKNMKFKMPVTLVVTPQGDVIFYKIGQDKWHVSDIEKLL